MCVIEPQVTEEGTRRAGGARPLLRVCSLGPAWALLPHAGSHSPPLPGAVLSRRGRSVAVESSHYGRRGPALPHLADQMSSTFVRTFFDLSCRIYYALNVHVYVGLFLDFPIPLCFHTQSCNYGGFQHLLQ